MFFKNIFYYLFLFTSIQPLSSHDLLTESHPYPDCKSNNLVDKDELKIQKITVRNIFVQGNSIFDSNYISDISGIHTGDIVFDTKIANSLRKLWRSNLFRNISVFKKKVAKDKIDILYKIEDLDEIDDIKIKEKGGYELNKNKFLSIQNMKYGYRMPPHFIRIIKEDIQSFYENKGYPNVQIKYNILINRKNSKKILYFFVIKGKTVEIEEIDFDGNKMVSDEELLTCMLHTKTNYPFPLIQKPIYSFVQDKIEKDLVNIQEQYQSVGNRYANIFLDSVWKQKNGNYGLKIKVMEGKRYYIRNIEIHGNKHVDSEILKKILLPKMAKKKKNRKYVYNKIKIEKNLFGKDCRSIISHYLNLGYLFINISLEEKIIGVNQIDLLIRINENKPVYIHEIKIKGNVITNESIIRRELKIHPGEVFSTEKIKQSLIFLEELNLFDKIFFRFIPSKNNSVDIEWNVVEKNNNEIQLQGTLGGNTIKRLIGRLNFNFHNFSIQKIFQPSSWNPVPQGSGQKLRISSEFGKDYHSYGFSFTEPWIKKKNPISVTIEANHLRKEIINNEDTDSLDESLIDTLDGNSRDQLSLDQTLGSLILSTRIPFIDPFSRISFYINGEKYRFSKKNSNSSYYKKRFQFNDVNAKFLFERDSTILNPIFPFSGSSIKLEGVLSPKYTDIHEKKQKTGDVNDQKTWMNYFKIKLLVSWYKQIMDRFVLKLMGETGYIGNYQEKKSKLPFHKFYMGGVHPKVIGNNYISFRGYDFPKKSSKYDMASFGGSFYKKIALELRYLFHNSPALKMWTLFFMEAGNVDDSYRIFGNNLFQVNKSFGVGFRSYWSPIGFIGIDFGYPINSFMKKEDNYFNSKWTSHIIMDNDA